MTNEQAFTAFLSWTWRSHSQLTSKLSFHTCECIHEGGQRPIQHLEEGVSAGIFLRSTQHCMLQDVWYPCAVHGGRPELDTKRERPSIFKRLDCFYIVLLWLEQNKQTKKPHNANLKRLLESSRAACRYWAPVLSCVSFTAVRNRSGTATTWEGTELVALITNGLRAGS